MSNINIPKDQIQKFCRKHFIKKLSLFGSVLSDEFDKNSDVDVLVEFNANQSPGFFGLAQMRRELSVIFNGRKIDLLTPKGISRYLRNEITSSALAQYAE